ncbi:MAG: SagB/ThcOx family dehydrogenase [Betaproteobacteria bacterium]|nr:SagB/ThcOx family dehydrogenase [Betaproteobacteria bacterium]
MDILDYHSLSKHHPGRYAPGPERLDWASQPDPFRSFAGAPRLVLPLAADDPATPYSALRAGTLPRPAPFDLRHVALLLELSLGLSAWKEYLGTRWALRCNPSSGNLHPTEGYVIAPELPGLPAGVWHYHSRDHALERRAALPGTDGFARSPGEGDGPAAVVSRGAVASPAPEGVLLALTSIAWREAWKYGLRAFRYCQHDCGHAIGAVALAAGAMGWRAQLLEGAGDDVLAALTGVDREGDFADAERELPEALLWIGIDAAPPECRALAGMLREASWQGQASRLGPTHVDWPDIERAVAASHAPAGAAPASLPSAPVRGGGDDALARPPGAAPASQPPAPRPPLSSLPCTPAGDAPAARLIRQRRSAVAFDGATVMPAPAFFTVLDATLPRPAAPPWSAWPWPVAVHLLLFVHRVAGLEPGLYLLAREPAALPALRAAMRPDWLWQEVGPQHLSLRLLLPNDVRAAAQFVACHQEIAADSCFALGMVADFDGVAGEPWRYRRLFWECGLIGQVLYLEAEAAGLRGTGIGCFFDDEMHELLGLEGQRWQSLYHFTVGGALEDARLTTLPPYPPHRRTQE